MPATKDLSKNIFPLPLLVCVALMVAMVGGARYWETVARMLSRSPRRPRWCPSPSSSWGTGQVKPP
ncbi:hypothetical protein [Pseudarthrobacter cellobiosi]|uniref:hypothetical protein n=1 Tax=Pseudarthrobacter cellobiosi TaxID=2953654 RepID=UPI00208F021B|nr:MULTISPECIES: hypothetical protein [unclassified Pseudarthrobacter]MCO4276708.1 hypothetical protein [Pseudarthrobacter sp. HLT3-5]